MGKMVAVGTTLSGSPYRNLSSKGLCAILSSHGFVEVRRRGSHVVMQKKLPKGTITVPVPDHNEIRIGALQSIIRQSGLPRSEFESMNKKGPPPKTSPSPQQGATGDDL